MTVPMMVMGGSGDTVNIPERTSYPIYEHLGSSNKSFVVLANADHWIFTQPRQEIPWMGNDIPYFVHTDPVWDMNRAGPHQPLCYSVPARYAEGRPSRPRALLPDAVNFPGIEYTTKRKKEKSVGKCMWRKTMK